MRAVVTGANGFIGKVLSNALVLKQYTISEINRINESGVFSNCNLYLKQDIKNIAAGIHEFKPNVIFHLAAKTSIEASWKSPFELMSENITLGENLLEAIHSSDTNPLLVLVSSSAVYDESPSVIAETYRLAPSSPYAVSKLASESLALRYANSLIVRPFFTVGANRKGDIVDEWLSAIEKIKISNSPGILNVGDLSLERDYLDVDECSRILIEIAEKGSAGEIYNVCSGISTSLESVCTSLIDATKCSTLIAIKSNAVQNTSSKKRVVGDTSKLSKLGIIPKFNLRESLKSIVEQRGI